jgi:hypothetical protein
MKKIKCPVCGGKAAWFYERFTGEHLYKADEEGYLLPDTVTTMKTLEESRGTEALCGDCGKMWKIRGIKRPGLPTREGEAKGGRLNGRLYSVLKRVSVFFELLADRFKADGKEEIKQGDMDPPGDKA